MKALIFVFLLMAALPAAYAEITIDQAEALVKSANCGAYSVAEALGHKIKKHSQRDLGWHSFESEGVIDVERAVLVNKGKRIHYRWRVNADGNVQPVSKKAGSLCSP